MQAIHDDLFEQLESFITRLFSLSASEAANTLADMDLSFTQVRTLLILAHRDCAMPISDLARCLNVSPATAGRAVEHLVALQLTERVENPHDRRVKNVSLTEQGSSLADQQREDKRAALRAFVSRVPTDQAEALIAALDPILSGSALQIDPKESA